MGSESMFLVCGLCSQVADEAMTIDDAGLRTFLVHMLAISSEDLPAKVCTDCYQGTGGCKKLADRCSRAIARLKNTQIAANMILGKSPGKGNNQGTSQEGMFLVCGLCSQVANESMTIDDAGLRSFLVHMLSITNEDLPTKICTDCFPEMAECKKFADRCGRAIARLKNTQIADNMILGGKTPKKEKKEITAAASQEVNAEQPAPAAAAAPSPVKNDSSVTDAAPPPPPAKKPPPPPKPKPSPASKKQAAGKSQVSRLSTDLIIDSPSGRRATRGASTESPAAGRKATRGSTPSLTPGKAKRGAVNKEETPAARHKTPRGGEVAAERVAKKRPSTAPRQDPPAPGSSWDSWKSSDSLGTRSWKSKGSAEEWERHPVTHFQFRSLTAKRNQPKVVITGVAKSLSDQALQSGNMSINYK